MIEWYNEKFKRLTLINKVLVIFVLLYSIPCLGLAAILAVHYDGFFSGSMLIIAGICPFAGILHTDAMSRKLRGLS